MSKLKLSITGLAMLLYSATSAAAINFGCITNNNTNDCAIGANQLSVEVTETGANQVRFDFYNIGSAASSIEGVYFDDGTLLGISYLIDKDENSGLAGVDFTGGLASPGELPGANNATPDFQTTAGFLADSDSPTSKNGVNPGEWLGIVFNLQSGGTYNDVMSELSSGELRIGLHVIAYQSGGSESFINMPYVAPVPVPAAAWLMSTGLMGLFGIARRGKNLKKITG